MKGDRIKLFLPEDSIEPEALEQVKNTASVPFLHHHVAVMPDCHFGMGSTVGTVIPTKGAVIPAAVGVDIGCGMIAVRTNLKRDDLKDIKGVREGIERRIPVSAGGYNKKITETAGHRIKELEEMAGEIDYQNFDGKWHYQMGSLGSGNHFIELSLDEHGDVWAVLHSGSRGIGNKIAQSHIKIAKKLMDTWFIQLPDPDLAYLPQGIPEFGNYIRDLKWAQHFALLNREEMMDRVMAELATHIFDDHKRAKELEVERINCHHNFTRVEHHLGADVWVTRKGAIEATEGKMAFIPGSMGTRSYVVQGKGNPMSFNSAPHGAGRRMSRGEARRTFTMKDFDEQIQDVEVRRDEAFIDELPGAYKDIDEVMENAKDLVEIRYTLKQFLNVKGK